MSGAHGPTTHVARAKFKAQRGDLNFFRFTAAQTSLSGCWAKIRRARSVRHYANNCERILRNPRATGKNSRQRKTAEGGGGGGNKRRTDGGVNHLWPSTTTPAIGDKGPRKSRRRSFVWRTPNRLVFGTYEALCFEYFDVKFCWFVGKYQDKLETDL